MPTIPKPAAGDTPWTNTGGQMIDVINTMQDYYFEGFYDDTAVGQTLTFTTWTKLTVNTEVADTGNNFDNATYIYTVPATGRYICFANIRVKDNDVAVAAGVNVAVGIHTSEIDGTWVKWDIIPDTATALHPGRFVVDYVRFGTFTQGDLLRLYAWHEEPTNMIIWRTRLTIWRVS